MRIAIDCDDAAYELKNELFRHLKNAGYNIIDLDYLGSKTTYYPEIASNMAKKIADHEYDRGILLCGTGLGMAICANKTPGIYAGCVHDVYSAERLSKSNNAQIITMGARVVGMELAKMLAEAFLRSSFEKERSLNKIMQLRKIEEENMKLYGE